MNRTLNVVRIQWTWKLMDLAARLPVVWRWPYYQRWQPRWTDSRPPRYPEPVMKGDKALRSVEEGKT